MENKKTIIGIIIVVILIIALGVTSYLYNNFNTKQVKILTEESNKLLQTDIATGEIDTSIKTEKTYAIVEKSMKQYLVNLQKLYTDLEVLNTEINPNDIFSAKNMPEKNLGEIDNIIAEYKEQCQNKITELEELITEEKITENIKKENITSRKEHYLELYNAVMLSEVMKSQFTVLEEKTEKSKDRLYSKLNQLEKIKQFLEDKEDYWYIKEDKVNFKNINIMTEYYDLVNELID